MNEYVWVNGSRISGKVSAQIAGDVLDELQQVNGGRITARVVLDAARPDEAPLHPCFEWDNLRAAELFREEQARHVINAVRIVERAPDEASGTTLIHAYVSLVEQVGDESERAYVPMARLRAEPLLLRQALERAAAELRSFEDKYKAFDVIATATRTARETIEASVQAVA